MQVIARLITSVHTWLNDHKHKQLHQLMSIAASSKPPSPPKKQSLPDLGQLVKLVSSTDSSVLAQSCSEVHTEGPFPGFRKGWSSNES